MPDHGPRRLPGGRLSGPFDERARKTSVVGLSPTRAAPGLAFVLLAAPSTGCVREGAGAHVVSCLDTVLELRDQGALGEALAALEGCGPQSLEPLVLAVEQASLLYRLGQLERASAAWAHALERSRHEGDADREARAAAALAQTLVELGDPSRAEGVLADLRRREAKPSSALEDVVAYAEAIVAKALGRLDEAETRLERLSDAAEQESLRVAAAIARANLLGRTGRAEEAFLLNVALVERRDVVLSPVLRAEALHAGAWHGILRLEGARARGLEAPVDLVRSIEAMADEARALFRAAQRWRAVAAHDVDRAWMSHVLGRRQDVVAWLSEVDSSSAALGLRERGYLTLLRAERRDDEGAPDAARGLLRGWLEAFEGVDPDVDVRARLRLAALDPLSSQAQSREGWRGLGRLLLTAQLLTGPSDLLLRHAPMAYEDLRRHLRAGRVEVAFARASLLAGAAHQRVRLQSCRARQPDAFARLSAAYWRVRERELEQQRAYPTLSQAGLVAWRATRRKARLEIDRALRDIEVLCAPDFRRTWDSVVTEPGPWLSSVRAELLEDEALLLPFEGGWFVLSREGLSYLQGHPRAKGLPRHVYVVVPVGKPRPPLPFHDPSLDPTVSFLPASDALSELRSRGPCTREGGPVIVLDPRSDLPAARRAQRSLQRRHPGANLLIGPAATTEAVARLALRASWFHYEGHAEADEAGVQLLLSDGTLGPLDVVVRDAAPCVAILLGCSTALRAARAGTTVGWVDVLLARGTRAVLATQAELPDDAAGALSSSFAPEPGESLASALRRALAAAIGTHPSLSSRIELWGDARAPLHERSDPDERPARKR